MKDDQGVWNFLFTVFFAGVFLELGYILYQMGRLPIGISLFDSLLVTLATFRVTRLFVYDKITQFIRDWFLDKEVAVTDRGEVLVIRTKAASGPRRTLHELLACPWCFGMWSALFVAFFYFLTPLFWFPIFVLAVAGVASLVQLLANMIGWRAENLKQETEGKETFDTASLPR